MKKLLKSILATTLILTTSITPAFAETNQEDTLKMIESNSQRSFSGSIQVGYRSSNTKIYSDVLNNTSTMNITMPSDKTQLVQGTITVIGNRTNKIREYDFANYAYSQETINIRDFNEPCTIRVYVEGRGTSRELRTVSYFTY